MDSSRIPSSPSLLPMGEGRKILVPPLQSSILVSLRMFLQPGPRRSHDLAHILKAGRPAKFPFNLFRTGNQNRRIARTPRPHLRPDFSAGHFLDDVDHFLPSATRTAAAKLTASTSLSQ